MDSGQRSACYAIYRVVHEQFRLGNITLKRSNTLIGSVLSDSPAGWRVIGITPAALNKFAGVGFRHVPKGVQRAHLCDRIDTAAMVLARNLPLTMSELFDIWEGRDQTVLGLSTENKTISETRYHKILNPNGELFSNKYVGYRYSRSREGRYLQTILPQPVGSESRSDVGRQIT